MCDRADVSLLPFLNQSFVARVEAQLTGSDELNVRRLVNENYERITAAILDCLQQMAKMDGEAGHAGEAKDQLNYHVILIGESSVGRSFRVVGRSTDADR